MIFYFWDELNAAYDSFYFQAKQFSLIHIEFGLEEMQIDKDYKLSIEKDINRKI